MQTAPNPQTEPKGQEGRLSSWKEIAAFLQVSVRTAQKWEEERGLPVHRLPGPRGPLFARVEELNEWLKSADSAAGVARPGEARPAEDRVESAESTSIRRKRRWILWSVAAAVVCCMIAGVSYLYWRVSGVPVSVRVQGREIVTVDAHGRDAWRKLLHRELERSAYDPESDQTPPLTWVGDLDGDGNVEVLFAATWRDRMESGVLYCFSQTGDEKWTYRPGGRIQSGEMEFPDHFNAAGLYVTPMGKGWPNSVLLVATHHTSYPCQVSLLSSEGQRFRQYWHSGHIGNVLRAVGIGDLDYDGVHEIYLGGESNATKRATLVALSPDEFEGASEEDAPKYQLLDFRTGRELFRILFPRNCVSSKLDVPGLVREIRIERDSLGLRTAYPDVHYSDSIGFSLKIFPKIRVENIDFSSFSSVQHAKLRAQGLLDHDFDPDREKMALGKIEIKRPPQDAPRSSAQ